MYNEIKIRFNEPQYTINEIRGTVICTLTYSVVYPDCLSSLFKNNVYTVKAKAKTCIDDIFDEKTGKRVALAKAESKAYINVGKQCFKHCGNLGKMYDKLYAFYAKAIGVIDHNDKYLNKF